MAFGSMAKWAIALSLAAAAGAACADAASVDAALTACARDVNDSTRLACYDKAVAQLSADAAKATADRAAAAAVVAAQTADANKAAAAAKAQADAEAKTAAFGADRINRNVIDTEKLTRLDGKVSEMLTASDGMAVLLLDNGQLWRQTTGMPLPPVRPGDPVVIEASKLGSFQLTLVRQHRGFNAKRIR
jgi:hypothetical protein